MAEKLFLEKVYFVPAREPPHKDPTTIVASAEDRLKMLEMAVEENPLFQISQVELDREGPSYTIDTLMHFYRRFDKKVYFITGIDTIVEVPAWHRFPEHFNYCIMVTAPRPGCVPDDFHERLEKLYHSEKGFEVSRHEIGYYGNRAVLFLNVKTIDVSATEIREMLRAGESIRYLVPENVHKYIMQKKLYCEDES